MHSFQVRVVESLVADFSAVIRHHKRKLPLNSLRSTSHLVVSCAVGDSTGKSLRSTLSLRSSAPVRSICFCARFVEQLEMNAVLTNFQLYHLAHDRLQRLCTMLRLSEPAVSYIVLTVNLIQASVCTNLDLLRAVNAETCELSYPCQADACLGAYPAERATRRPSDPLCTVRGLSYFIGSCQLRRDYLQTNCQQVQFNEWQ